MARRVETFDDYATANDVRWLAFGVPDQEVAGPRSACVDSFDGPLGP